jgi:broad specificity phosphatase PhoE
VLRALHLVRHGEVHNPDHVVYADLDGFGLSDIGRTQAIAAARHLRLASCDAIVTSPLDRAVETAAPIASATNLTPITDDRLTEWALGIRWAGVGWDDLPDRFPGELEAYLVEPTDLDFASESIDQVVARMAQVVIELGSEHPGGTAVVVSHQDPIQALRLFLTNRPLAGLHLDKPGHGSVITLQSTHLGWSEASEWVPEIASEPFPPLDDPDRL